MASFPKFILYESDGVTPVYEFDCILDWGNSPFQDPKNFVEHVGLRGQGSIIIEGSEAPWDFTMRFFLKDVDYESLVAQMKSVISTIEFNTKYILKIDLTSGGSTEDLKVKRLNPVDYPPSTNGKKVIDNQIGNISFRVNSWS
jgi:hypothetical protein